MLVPLIHSRSTPWLSPGQFPHLLLPWTLAEPIPRFLILILTFPPVAVACLPCFFRRDGESPGESSVQSSYSRIHTRSSLCVLHPPQGVQPLPPSSHP